MSTICSNKFDPILYCPLDLDLVSNTVGSNNLCHESGVLERIPRTVFWTSFSVATLITAPGWGAAKSLHLSVFAWKSGSPRKLMDAAPSRCDCRLCSLPFKLMINWKNKKKKNLIIWFSQFRELNCWYWIIEVISNVYFYLRILSDLDSRTHSCNVSKCVELKTDALVAWHGNQNSHATITLRITPQYLSVSVKRLNVRDVMVSFSD